MTIAFDKRGIIKQKVTAYHRELIFHSGKETCQELVDKTTLSCLYSKYKALASSCLASLPALCRLEQRKNTSPV